MDLVRAAGFEYFTRDAFICVRMSVCTFTFVDVVDGVSVCRARAYYRRKFEADAARIAALPMYTRRYLEVLADAAEAVFGVVEVVVGERP
jgi:hypothetical protein